MPFIVLLLLLLLPLPALADSPNKDKSTYRIPPYVVRDSLFDEPATSTYHLPESAKAATWQVGRKDIEEMHPTNLYDIVQYAPGLDVQFQGRKAMNFVQGRGGGTYAIVLDGVYVPWTQAGRVMANFPTDTIESVTVVRDSTVLTLGPLVQLGVQESSLQGFILIRTRSGQKQGKENEVRLGYASNNRYKIFARHGSSLNDLTYSLSYNKKHDDGYKTWNNGSDSDSLLANAGYDTDGLTAHISLYTDWASREIQRSTADSRTSGSRWEYDPLRTIMLSGTVTKKWNESQATMFGAYFGRVDTNLNLESYMNNSSSTNDQKDQILQFDLRHVISGASNTLTIGGQTLFWETPTGQFYYETYPRREELYSAYIQDEYRICDGLTVDGGVRFERKHITDGVDRYAPTQVTAEVLKDKWATPSYNVSAGVSWWPGKSWKLSMRTSLQSQSSDSFLTTISDEDLPGKIEWRRELGVNAYLHPMFNPSLTFFSYDIDNLKSVVASIGRGVDAINIYDAIDVVRNGVEIGVNGTLVQNRLTYDLNYSWQDSDNSDDDRTLPENMLSGRLGFMYAPFKAHLMAKYVSRYESNFLAADNDYHRIGDYARVDANVSYDFTAFDVDSTLILYGQNLLDDHYQSRLGWKDSGMILGVELACKF